MSAIRQFLHRVKTSGEKRATSVKTVAMGRVRKFDAYDIGNDTFILERNIGGHLKERPSVLVVNKADLRHRTKGRVMTITTGNHSVAALPLLDGRFWRLSNVPSPRRGDVLTHNILCANVVGDAIEVSQREVPTEWLVEQDAWLLGPAGFSLPDIVMGERNDATLEHYRKRGQEWRVRALAWTAAEVRAALAASRKRIVSKIRYYHSTRGVHLLSFSDFRRFAALAQTEPEEFAKGLRELVGVFPGNALSFTRMPKHRGHHEIEFFGLRRGEATKRLVPELELLAEAMALGKVGAAGAVEWIDRIVSLYESLLTRPEFADDETKEFADGIYMYVTGEIYSVMGEGSTPAFDDHRTALPGATFVDGRPEMHPGADERTAILLHNLRGLLSKDERVEYANVYELRSDDEDAPLGKGRTREVVYKTDRSPLEFSQVEKRLSRATKDYGSYMLARVYAFKSLGVALSEYRLLHRRAMNGKRPFDFYIRDRCEGEPMSAIPANYFCSADDSSVEEADVVLRLATLMGDAAAQNMAMKKFDPITQTPLYGVGKEIYEFEYDLLAHRVMPKRVSICSVRGSFGWSDLSRTDENLHALGAFYLQHYAHALKDFQRRHGVSMALLAERFMGGFEVRTHAMGWQLSVLRDKFEAFAPVLPREYDFEGKWRFALWALDRQERRLPVLRRMFFEKVKVVEDESIRNNPQ